MQYDLQTIVSAEIDARKRMLNFDVRGLNQTIAFSTLRKRVEKQLGIPTIYDTNEMNTYLQVLRDMK